MSVNTKYGKRCESEMNLFAIINNMNSSIGTITADSYIQCVKMVHSTVNYYQIMFDHFISDMHINIVCCCIFNVNSVVNGHLAACRHVQIPARTIKINSSSIPTVHL